MGCWEVADVVSRAFAVLLSPSGTTTDMAKSGSVLGGTIAAPIDSMPTKSSSGCGNRTDRVTPTTATSALSRSSRTPMRTHAWCFLRCSRVRDRVAAAVGAPNRVSLRARTTRMRSSESVTTWRMAPVPYLTADAKTSRTPTGHQTDSAPSSPHRSSVVELFSSPATCCPSRECVLWETY
jgi:hypothetical protein